MRKRALGGSGLEVPPVIFGGNVFGWTVDRTTGFRLLDAMADAGLNAIDTADIYSTWAPGHSGGESETMIGEWLQARGPARRRAVVILSKCGGEMPGQGKGLSPAWIERAVDASLRRLGVERIDLHQAHFDDQSVPLEETLGAFAKLIDAGKVGAIGASNYTAPRLRAALEASDRNGLPRYQTLQPHHNLMERGIESDLLPLCREEGIGVIPYYALAAGFLTGKYRARVAGRQAGHHRLHRQRHERGTIVRTGESGHAGVGPRGDRGPRCRQRPVTGPGRAGTSGRRRRLPRTP